MSVLKVLCLVGSLVGCCMSILAYGQPPENCKPLHGITPYCGIQGPEDMVQLPDTPYLLLGLYGGHRHRWPSRLLAFHTGTGERQELFSSDTDVEVPDELWGDPNCKSPTRHFSPHGIDLIERPDGRLMLLVVNHDGFEYPREIDNFTESIQFFHVVKNKTGISVRWQGCVQMPPNLFLNDVAATPDGGFVVGAAHIHDKALFRENFLAGSHGQIMRWHPKDGFDVIHTFKPGGYINGVNVSPDGQTLFANDSVLGQVSKISLETGKVLATASVRTPDNNSWAENGKLLVTSILIDDMAKMEACDEHKNQPCGIAFAVSSLDPETMKVKEIFFHDGSPPFGAATVVVPVGNYLYLGAALGDRMARVRMPR